MLIGLTINAQTINVRGTVSNSAGKPIANATVKLTGRNLSAVTGADGAYIITKTGIVKLPAGKTFQKESLSVIKNPEKTDLRIRQQGQKVSLSSSDLTVALDLKSGIISFSNKNGILLSEKESGVPFTDFNDAGVQTSSVSQSFLLDKDEAIYGLGEQQQGKMIQRNLKLNMIQGNTDDYIPFFLSVKGYGLFWDNYSPTIFEDTPEATTFKSDVGDCMDYYFMYGSNADGVIAQMRDLTGQVPMFPLWTYGFWHRRHQASAETSPCAVP
jgi:alpha-D-xyloside xylohydrolase